MASSSRARAVVIASGIFIATPAAAQSSDTPPPPPAAQEKPPAPPPPQPARPMNMQPGAQAAPPPKRAPKRHAAPPNRKGKGKGHHAAAHAPGTPIAGGATFYRLDDGSTRVSVEVSEKVPVAESRAQGRLIYRFKGVFIPARTNTLPLLTGFFATPVDRAQLVQDGPDVELVIDLRDATTPTHRVVETSRGMVLQVDFPRVANADRPFEVPDNAGRDRAKRRTDSQSLGTDHKEGE